MPHRRSLILALSITCLAALLLAPAVRADDPAPDDGKAKGRDVTVTSPGAEPRSVLRYKPVAKSKQDVHFGVDIAIEQMGMEMAFPTILVDVSVEVLEVMENGNFKLRATVEKTGSEGEDTTGMAPMVLATLDSMKGLRVTTMYSCSGRTLASEVSEADISNPMQREMFEIVSRLGKEIVTPLPEEAIGPGAKWTHAVAVEGLFTIDAERVFELVEAKGDKLSLKFATTQTAKAGQTFDSGMGFQMVVKKLEGKGTGTHEIDLVGAVTTGKISVETSQVFTFDMGAGEQEIERVATMSTSATAKPAAATTAGGDGDGKDGG